VKFVVGNDPFTGKPALAMLVPYELTTTWFNVNLMFASDCVVPIGEPTGEGAGAGVTPFAPPPETGANIAVESPAAPSDTVTPVDADPPCMLGVAAPPPLLGADTLACPGILSVIGWLTGAGKLEDMG
jgi:hypothetical protein